MNAISTSANGEPRGLSTYTRVLEGGDVTEFNVRGNFVRIKETPGDIDVTLRNSQLGSHGVEFTNPMKKFEKIFSAMEYDSVVVVNNTGARATITLQLGYGDYEAEIISRTLSAQSMPKCGNPSSPGITLDSSTQTTTFTVCGENLQRKRVWVSCEYIASDLDAIYVTLSSNPSPTTEEASYAMKISGAASPLPIETTSALYMHIVLRDPADTITGIQVNAFASQELYTAA